MILFKLTTLSVMVLFQTVIHDMKKYVTNLNDYILSTSYYEDDSVFLDSQTQKELEDLRSELAKYKLFFNNAG